MFILKSFIIILIYFCFISQAFSENNSAKSYIEQFIESLFANGKQDQACQFLDSLEKKNIPEAIYMKGVFILNGIYDYGKANPIEATRYFSRAAALGYPKAIAALADSYLDGDGTIKDEKEAFRLYKKAADLGCGSAQFNVAILYRDGLGTKKSPKLAIKYMRMAAKNNETISIKEDAQIIIDKIINEMKHQ